MAEHLMRGGSGMMDAWKWLTDHIPVGHTAAISATDLSKLVEAEPRELRRIIESARRDNILICGDQHGYYFPESAAEIAAYVHRVRSRIKTGCVCLAPFLRQIKEAERGGGS